MKTSVKSMKILDGCFWGGRPVWGCAQQSPGGCFTLCLHLKQFHYLAHHTVISFTLLCLIQGQSIIPMLTGEVIPVMELLASMKSHSVPEEIDVTAIGFYLYPLWIPLSDCVCACMCVCLCFCVCNVLVLIM